MRVHFRRDNRGTAAGFRHRDGHQSDRTAARDGYGSSRDISGKHGVHGVAQRVHDRRVVLRDGRVDLPDIPRRNAHELGEASVLVDADHFYELANVRLSNAARQATAAIHVHFRAHKFAFADSLHVRADFFHRAAEFMTEGERRVQARSRPAVPMIDVHVRSADRSRADAHQHFIRPRRRNRNGFQLRALLGTRLAKRFHGMCQACVCIRRLR